MIWKILAIITYTIAIAYISYQRGVRHGALVVVEQTTKLLDSLTKDVNDILRDSDNKSQNKH